MRGVERVSGPLDVPGWGDIFVVGRREGGVAQLGERLHGMQEVVGSIPSTSIIYVTSVLIYAKIYASDDHGCRCAKHEIGTIRSWTKRVTLR